MTLYASRVHVHILAHMLLYACLIGNIDVINSGFIIEKLVDLLTEP